MSEESTKRLWAELSELKELLVRALAVQDEREKSCNRQRSRLNRLDEQMRHVEINQAKWSVLAAIGSAVLTAGAVKLLVG